MLLFYEMLYTHTGISVPPHQVKENWWAGGVSAELENIRVAV